MKVEFTFEYGTRLTPDQAHKLAPLVTVQGRHGDSGELLIGPDKEGEHRWWGNLTGELELILAAIPELTSSIKLVHGELTPTGLEYIIRALKGIEERLRTPAPVMNEHVKVVVPSLGMLLIDEVAVVENYCTDSLQRDLNDGWRILAVCPQDARRPDYVLGRARKKEEQ